MAWFGKSQEQKDKEWKQQQMEYDGVANTLHRLSSKCFKRCAQNVSKAELSTTEMMCLDRCTRKYIHSINTVSLRTQEISRKYMPAQLQ